MNQTTINRERRQRRGIEQPRTIRNRDCVLLHRIPCIMQDVCRLETRRQWQKDRMFSITAKLTGMPGGSGGVPTGFDAAYAALSELDEEQSQRVIEYCRELKKAERILNTIPSRSMRTFVVMRYIDDLPGTEIMRELNMSEWGYKRACECIEQAEDMTHVKWRERYILYKKTENNS